MKPKLPAEIGKKRIPAPTAVPKSVIVHWLLTALLVVTWLLLGVSAPPVVGELAGEAGAFAVV